MFFQSDVNLEEQLIRVPSSTGAKFTLTVFLAVFGDIPHSDPCLKQICLGSSSECTLQPFSTRTAFNFG